MFSINNLRIGSITPTDYFLGSVPIQKMYLGRICVFDRTEAERTVYTFTANSSTVTGNADGGSTEIQIQSYKETYVGDTPQGDITRVSLTDTWMSQFPDWCTPSVKSDSSNTTWTIILNFDENTSSQARQANVTLTQQESNKQVTLTVKQEAGNVTTQYTLNVQPTEATLTGTDADKSTTFTVNTYKQQVINGEVQPTKTHVTCSFDSGTGGEEGVSISGKNNNNGTYTVTVTCMSSTQNKDYPIIVTQAESNKTATFTLHKVEPSVTYSDITITTFTYPDTVSAAGETVTPTLAYSQTYGYNGATTGGGTITSGATVRYSGTGVGPSTGAVTVESKGTTLSGETTVSEVTVTVSMNGKSASKTFTIKQEENRIESTDYGDWTIEVSDTMQAQPSGGTLHFSPVISRTVTNTYTSEAVEETTENDNDNYTLSSNQTWAVVSDKSVVVSTNDGETRSAIITLTSHEVSKQITITQSSGTEITAYGDITITGGQASDIPASGGTSKATGYTISQQVTYSNGKQETIDLTASADVTEVSADSLGTTVKDRTKVGTSVISISNGDKEASKSTDVYQQANEKTTGDITYGEWQVSVSANPTSVSNSGGTSTITRSAYRSRTQNYSYTSKATSTEKLSNETATPTLSSNQTWAVIQGTTVTISANDTDTSRTVTITASHEGKQATCTITQGASVKVYSDLNVTGLTFKQLPASGIASGQHVAQSYVTGGKVTQTWGWNTTTGGGTLTWNLPADISEFTTFDVQIASTVPSLGTTEREKHTINDIFTVNISQNGKTYNASHDGVQEANVKTPGDKRYNEDVYDTKQNANISPASPWEFDVGTVKTKFRLGVPTYQKYTYTSGSESEEQIADTVVIPNSVSFVKSGTNTPVEWVHSRTAIFDDPDYEYQYTVDNNGTGYSRTVDVLLYAVYPDQSLVTKLPITIHITQNAAPEMEYVKATVSNVVLNDAPASGISLNNIDNKGYNNIPNPSKYLKSCMVTITWRYEGREETAGNFVKYYPDDIDFLGSPMLFYCQYNTDSQNSNNVFVKNIDEKGTTISGRTQIPYYVRVQFISIDGSTKDAYGYSSAGVWYQEANQVESTSEEQGDKTVTKFEINNGTHTVNPQSGTLELQAVCSQTITTVKTYTSGATGREQSTNSRLKPASLESSQSWLTVPSTGSISWDSGKNAYTGNVSITANSSTSTRTAEVRCYPDSGKPSVYESITITQNAKTSTDSYGWWNFDEVTANTQSVTAAGGTVTLSGNAKRTVTHNWSDGTQTTSTETKPLSECSVTVNNSATVSSNKTTVTIPANQTTSAKSYTITMSVYGGGSNIKELTINQSADTYDPSEDTHGDWTVTVNASPLTIASTGGTSNITSSATRTVTHHWVSGRTTNEQESGTPTLSGSATGFNLSGNTLTAQSNVSTNGVQTLTKDNDLSDISITPEGILAYTVNSYVDRSITASRSITITATMGTKTNTVKVTQSGDPGGRTYYKPKTKTVQSGFEAQIKNSTYEANKYDVLIGVSKSNDNAFGTAYNQKLNTTVTITTDYPNSKTLDLACGWNRFYIYGVPTKVELSPSNNNSSSFELTSNGKWTIS